MLLFMVTYSQLSSKQVSVSEEEGEWKEKGKCSEPTKKLANSPGSSAESVGQYMQSN